MHEPTLASGEPDRYLTVDEVAQHLALSGMHVRRLISEGRLAASNFGNSHRRAAWRIKRSALAEYERLSSIGQK